MSDSVKKWYEMQEEKKIYESPDGGKTIRARKMYPGDITITEDVQVKTLPIAKLKKEAYKLLCEYDEDVIRMAMKIIDIGE